MSEPPKYGDISSDNTLNTLPLSQTEMHEKSGKSGKRKQKTQSEIESVEDEILAKFQPYDLKLLTFKPIESEQEVNIWHASPEAFHAYVSRYVGGFRNVNTSIWPLAERLAVVNMMWEFSQAHGKSFPFRRQHVVPHVDASPVPDVNSDMDKSASEAV